MSVNKAILIGRLGKDPELRYTPAGTAVVRFTIATNEKWTGQDGQSNERTVWHNIVAWGRQAEIIKEHLSKGRQVYIEGRIDNRSYDDKDGNKRYISEVVVQTFRFLGSRDDAMSESSKVSGNESDMPPPSSEPAGDDDDLPF